MKSSEMLSLRNPHVRISVGVTLGLLVLTALLGFIVLPYAQREADLAGLWDVICRAAGLPRDAAPAPDRPAAAPTSKVVLTAATLAKPSPQSIGRGATLAQRCAMCHGPTGISRADFPNLAGQYGAVVYKQLQDFRSGARVNAVMSPFAANLSDQDMVDLAAYYAYLPRLPAYHPEPQQIPTRIVVYGAPTRGIAPCGACHGSLDNKTGSPWLEGQSAVYLKAQLEAFASGHRRNDISAQMRNIARAMTPQEIEEAAGYYASQPVETIRAAE
ncbi:Putative cytochrome c; putative signal peptide [Bradyrhizobium sp. ORS 278]|uniref:c-type cytochrome n=1 Tax=Bradyrhizobium sp. (strain ORS 278) TaxID=114615 RepID=UPI0001507DE1|nr:c-type cytochrome [Bradyrhizobium sp. ORS 278]CAL76096.1 Putative cytochrome c; putative signal peptide [Bradyrhizobium sp. ORS 278]